MWRTAENTTYVDSRANRGVERTSVSPVERESVCTTMSGAPWHHRLIAGPCTRNL